MQNIGAILKRNYPQGMAGASGNGSLVRPLAGGARVLRRNSFNVRMSYSGALGLTFSARLADYTLGSNSLDFARWESHAFSATLAESSLDEVMTGHDTGLQYGAEPLPYWFFSTQRRSVYYEDFHTESLGWVVDERGDNAEISAYYSAAIVPDSFVLYTPWLENPVLGNYPEAVRAIAAGYGPGTWLGFLYVAVSAWVSFGSSTGFLPAGFVCHGHDAPTQDINYCGGGGKTTAIYVFAKEQHRIHSRLALAFDQMTTAGAKTWREAPATVFLSSQLRPIASGLTPVFVAG